MAPKNKRGTSPSTRSKRIKDEIKTSTTEQNEQQDKTKEEEIQEKHNNNNIIDSSEKNNSNGDEKVTSNEAKTDKVNGAKTKKEDDLAKVDSKEVSGDDKKQSEINGSKQEKEVAGGAAKKVEPASKSAAKDAPPSPPEVDENVGTLLICGGANWDMTGRKELPKTAKKPVEVNPAARNLWGPHKVLLDGSEKALRVKGVFSGCNACHSVIVTEEGVTMTFGRNDKGQLGLGDFETRTTPVVVEALRGINIVAAACGRSHTLFLSSDGLVFSAGDNKMGQCGTNQQSVQTISTPVRIAFKENKPVVRIACGAEFSMIVDIDGKLYSFGHPEHGQLGHNSEGKYFTSGNKYAFHCEYAPRRIVTFIEKSREGHVSPVDEVSITDIACGTNHTLAVDKKHRCFSWGFAGYHRLGHSETKNELVPRSIKVFDAPSTSGRGASKVFAGATHSMALDVNGLLYFWGQNKSSGEATMYPKNVQDLCGWKITAVSCANRSIFVIADETCISWGPSPTYGELGYGEGKSKSSTTPQEVKTLEGVHINDVACGFGHTLLISRDGSSEDQAALDKLKNWP